MNSSRLESYFHTKRKRIKIFLKWLASNENFVLPNNQHRLFLIVNCFNLLMKTITKYKILKKSRNYNTNKNVLNEFNQIKKLYNKIFYKSETLLNLNINIELLVFILRDLDNFTQINNFNFLKLNLTPKVKIIVNNNRTQSNLYFTNSFKAYKVTNLTSIVH